MWEDSFWHHTVHQRLGETLHYYFIRLRPFEPLKVASKIEQLFNRRDLGNIHCYQLFGRYDLLIRVWLHPNIVQSFRIWLSDMNFQALRVFDVNQIDYAWYGSGDFDAAQRLELLKGLTEEDFRDVQEDGGGELHSRLVKTRLILSNDPARSRAVKFFVSVALDTSQIGREEQVASDIITYIKSERNLFNEAVYRGHGECDILVKAQSNDFFSISRLPNWIGEQFRGAITETYFSHNPRHIFGSGRIGQSTFNEIRGRDLFAQSIVPELYDGALKVSPRIREEIEKFLREEVRALNITSNFRRFLHDYTLDYIKARKTEMLRTLFELFASIEEYLRRNRDKFVGMTCESKLKDIYQKAGYSDPEKRKYPSLGNLLKVYSSALKLGFPGDYHDLAGGWEELVFLRNKTAHGFLDPTESWSTTLKSLLFQEGRLSRLTEVIYEVTSDRFDGRYL